MNSSHLSGIQVDFEDSIYLCLNLAQLLKKTEK